MKKDAKKEDAKGEEAPSTRKLDFGRPKPAADGPEPVQPDDGGFASDLAQEIIKYSGFAKQVPDDGITIESFTGWTVEDITNHDVLSKRMLTMGERRSDMMLALLETRGAPALAWVLSRKVVRTEDAAHWSEDDLAEEHHAQQYFLMRALITEGRKAKKRVS